MKTSLPLIALLLTQMLHAQVELDVPLRLTGAEPARGVDGVAPPVTSGSAITVGFATAGAANWASMATDGDTILLSLVVPLEQAREGLLLRFLADGDLNGDVHISVAGTAPLPLRRPDGQYIMRGQIRSGTVCELVLAQGRYILTAPEPRGCPPETIHLGHGQCLDVNDHTGVSFYQATEYCSKEGGRLCRLEEYLTTCTHHSQTLNGLFDGWEWVDDTSDHSHSADAYGNTSCLDRTTFNPYLIRQVRCCFSTR